MRQKGILTNYLFILPAIAIFSLFYIYPFFKVFQLSLSRWNGISFRPEAFVGLAHFKELIFRDPVRWWVSVVQAGYITLWALTFQNILALLLALACNRAGRFGTIYRVIFFIPPILSEVVVGLVWWWIYDGNWGLLNHWLTQIGLGQFTHNWLSPTLQEGSAFLVRMLPLTSVAIVHCWKGFGWAFIILLAGLQSIPRELYDAARVDGADAWQTFWSVTFPLMIPVMVLVVILTILGSMQAFVLILAMTHGGPYYYTEVPVTRILNSMETGQFGFACAQALIFGVILLIVSFTQIRISRRLRQV
jgi:raffinose/stachyose/melibiose transport system permease protein